MSGRLQTGDNVQTSDLGAASAIIGSALALAGQGLKAFNQIRQGNRLREKVRTNRRLQSLYRSAANQISNLKTRLEQTMTKRHAQNILRTGAEEKYLAALANWRSKFQGLPAGDAASEDVARQIQTTYIEAAESHLKTSRIGKAAGWGALAIGTLLTGWAWTQDKLGF